MPNMSAWLTDSRHAGIAPRTAIRDIGPMTNNPRAVIATDPRAVTAHNRELKRLAKLIVSNAEAQKRGQHERYQRALDRRNGRPRP